MSFSAQLKYSNPADERSAERYRLLLAATGEEPGSGAIDVVVHDLSTTGFLVETEARLKVGSAILLDIPGAGSVAAEVAWNSGNFFGGQFEKPLTASGVSAAFAASRVVWPNFQAGSAADRAEIESRDFSVETVAEGEEEIAKAPLPVRLRVIAGVSLLLWLPLGGALWTALA